MTKLSKSQTGTPSSGNFSGAKGRRKFTARMPWGKASSARIKSQGKPSGSSTRKSKSAPELAPQTKGYPANQPSQWPVIPDYAGHTRTPSLSGVNSTTAATHNAAVEHAYTRAGYQNSP
jgi:hypothetical protein